MTKISRFSTAFCYIVDSRVLTRLAVNMGFRGGRIYGPLSARTSQLPPAGPYVSPEL